MKILKIILIFLGIALTLLLSFTAMLPSYLKIEREIVIYTPENYPYQIIKNLKSWNQWFPSLKMDHNINIYYNSNKQSTLFWNSSNPNVGKGSIIVIKKIPQHLIITNINLQNDKSGKLIFKIIRKSNYCLLKLEFATEMTFFEKWIGFFLDTVISPTLEKSLEDIKSISEYQFNADKK
jgi:hypothetical protein